MTILTKFQNDAKTAETAVLEYLASQVNRFRYQIDDFTARVSAPTNYVLTGQEFNAEIFLAPMSKTEKPEILVGPFTSQVKKNEDGSYSKIEGSDPPLRAVVKTLDTENGIAKFNEMARATGVKNYTGVVKVPKPEEPGNYSFFPFEFEYQAAAGGSVVSPTEMNVLYIGVKNPVSISAFGYPDNRVTASIGNGTIEKNGTGKYLSLIHI